MLEKLMKEYIHTLPIEHQLIYIVNLLWRSPYSWGHEMLGQVDCSGTISWGLYLLGYDVRITADDMYKEITDKHYGAPKAGNLLFFWQPDRSKIRHVALFIEDDIVLNAQSRATFRRWERLIAERQDQLFEIRKINWNKVLTLSNNRKAYGIDEKLHALFGLFA